VITEKSFALGFGGFWQELLPLLERYVRRMNLQKERFAAPLPSHSSKRERGVINEAGFRLFVASRRNDVPIAHLDEGVVEQSIDAALRYISTMRRFENEALTRPDTSGVNEAIQIAMRLDEFFRERQKSTLELDPPFHGCGLIQACSGDALASETLFEVKAGGRDFRGADVRQALTYCALNFAAKRYDISTLCLLNPRRGVSITESIEWLCRQTGGASSVEVLSTIVEYVSAGYGPDTNGGTSKEGSILGFSLR
jgi:hypothetical protein